MMKFFKTDKTMEIKIRSVVAYGQRSHWKRTGETFCMIECFVS